MTKSKLTKTTRAILLAAAASMALNACAQVVPRPKVEQPPEKGRVTFEADQPILSLPTSANTLLSMNWDRGDALPGNLVGPLEIKDKPLDDVLRTVTRGYNIPLAVGGGAEQRTVSISIPDKLPLAKVIDLVASQTDSFYEYRDGVLHVEGEKTFSVNVPNILLATKYQDLTDQPFEQDDNSDNGSGGSQTSQQKPDAPTDPKKAYSTIDAFADTFKALGADGVDANNRTGTISFKADKQAYRQLSSFMKDFSVNRQIIVYDSWIYEVHLADAKQAGIDWKKFATSLTDGTKFMLQSGSNSSNASQLSSAYGDLGSTSSTSSSSDSSGSGDSFSLPGAADTLRGAGGMTIGLMGTAGSTAIDAMFSFLNNQGEAKTLAEPKMSVIPGREGLWYNGDSISFIKELKVEDTGSNSNSSSNGSGSSGSSGSTDNSSSDSNGTSTDVKTRTLKTGVRLGITGDFNGGVVESNINLSMVNLLEMNNVNVKGYLLQLPHLSGRSLSTTVAARPGDVIMLSGMIYDQGTRNQDNLMVGNVPLQAAANSERSELVLLLRPRIVKFVPSKKAVDEAFSEKPLEVGPSLSVQAPTLDTSVRTPDSPEAVKLKESPTEKTVIDGVKADDAAASLADEARKAIEQAVPPLPAPVAPGAAPAAAPGAAPGGQAPAQPTVPAQKPAVPAKPATQTQAK